MAQLYSANLMIRESRKAQGLTQEQLAEGICSRETIVKLEKGERKPNWFVFKEILLRLGLDPDIYSSDVGSQEDVYVLKRMNEMHRLIVAYDITAAKDEIEEIEKEKNSPSGMVWRSGLGYELMLRAKASFYSLPLNLNEYNNPALAIEYAMECLQITRPGFEIDKIPDYYLAEHEYRLLTSLALAYQEIEGATKAINLWQILKTNIEKNYSESIKSLSNKWYRDLLNNMAIILYKTGRYEECLQIAEEGLTLAKATYNMFHYYNHLNCKSYCLKKLGREDDGGELCKKALLLSYVLGLNAGAEFIETKKEYERLFGERLDLSVPW